MITWAKRVSGLSPETKRDLISRVNRMTEILTPETKEAFLEDLAAQRLGMTVTMNEAGKISELAKTVMDKKIIMDAGGDRMEYGRARVAFGNYVSELKTAAKKRTVTETLKDPLKILSEVAGAAKATKASMDNSAIFRQGWKTLWTNPMVWQKNARRSFVDLVQTLGGKPVMDELNADAVSRPTHELAKKAKLAIGTLEEEFPSVLPEKVPVVGRLYKASEVAFTAFVYRQRLDIFDKYIDVAERSGVDLTDKDELRSIGKLVNSLTGRGALGRLEPVADVVNNVFFSPRLLKSHIDTLLLHPTDAGFSPFARKQAASNILKIISGTAMVLLVANAMLPDSVEDDPRSVDFGKIRVGNTRFDVTGGMGSLVTLASRLITMSTKASTTGLVTELNVDDFGSRTGLDVVYDFFENKLSPAASLIKTLLEGKDWEGDKPTIEGELDNLFTPIIITNYFELKDDPKSADIMLAMIAEGLGISANTYSIKANWENSTSKELQQFKEKVGDKRFKEANDEYNKRFNDWFLDISKDPRYRKLPMEERQEVMTKKKSEIKKDIFKQYNFKYKRATEASDNEVKTLIKELVK